MKKVIRVVLFCFFILPSFTLFTPSSLWAIDMAPYYSQGFVPGNYWTYLVNNDHYETSTVLSGTLEINGIPTTVRETVTNLGPILYYYNSQDSTGSYFHRMVATDRYIEDLGYFDYTYTFNPPIKRCNAIAEIGDVINNTTTVQMRIVGSGVDEQVTGAYTESTEICGFENITTALGNFDTLKITRSNSMSYSYGGIDYFITSTAVYWTVPSVGSVRTIINTSDGTHEEGELVETNLLSISAIDSGSGGGGGCFVSTILP